MEALKNAFDFSDQPRIDLTVAGALALFLLIFPLLPLSAFALATMIQFFIFSLYGMGWNTIGGYGGQVDLGKAQYVGIGAYTTAVMLIRWDIPFWFSMPIGVLLAMPVIWWGSLALLTASVALKRDDIEDRFDVLIVDTDPP